MINKSASIHDISGWVICACSSFSLLALFQTKTLRPILCSHSWNRIEPFLLSSSLVLWFKANNLLLPIIRWDRWGWIALQPLSFLLLTHSLSHKFLKSSIALLFPVWTSVWVWWNLSVLIRISSSFLFWGDWSSSGCKYENHFKCRYVSCIWHWYIHDVMVPKKWRYRVTFKIGFPTRFHTEIALAWRWAMCAWKRGSKSRTTGHHQQKCSEA